LLFILVLLIVAVLIGVDIYRDKGGQDVKINPSYVGLALIGVAFHLAR